MCQTKKIVETFSKNVEHSAITFQEYESFEKLNRSWILLIPYICNDRPAQQFSDIWITFGSKLELARTQLERVNLFSTCILEKMLDTMDIGDIANVRKALRYVSLKLDRDSTCLMKDLNDSPTFFGILDELRSPSDQLLPLIKLQTFVILCNSMISCIYFFIAQPEPTDSPQLSPEFHFNDEGTEEELKLAAQKTIPTALQVSQFLETTCVEKYKEWIESVTKETVTLDELFMYSEHDMNISEEIKQAAGVFNMSVSDQLYSALVWLKDLDLHKSRVESINNTLSVLGFYDGEVPLFAAIDTFLDCLANRSEVTALEMERALLDLKGPLGVENQEWYDILAELSTASKLVDFLIESADDDFRNLIDAVEERTEQTIDESVVSDLIHVKRFIRPVLKKVHDTPDELFECLKMSLCKAEKEGRGMAFRINNCSQHVHSLRALYLHSANRGELTKEIVCNVMTKGSYEWAVNKDTLSCSVSLSYKISKDNGLEEYVYDAEQLNDLRSRALLISSSDRAETDAVRSGNAEKNCSNLKVFVEIVDIVTEIGLTLEELHNQGHFEYCSFVKIIRPSNEALTILTEFLNSKLEELNDWKRLLRESRDKFLSLNFIYSDQLSLFSTFLSGSEISFEDFSHLKSILQFVHPGASLECIESEKGMTNFDTSNIGGKLEQIGFTIDSLLQVSQCSRRHFPENKQFIKQAADVRAIVQPGVLYIVHLQRNSSQTIQVLLSLYANTSRHFPVPSEVLFCHELTALEELHLLIQRSVQSTNGDLHCICNVERLSNVLQYQLVDELSSILQNRGSNNRLAVICRGGQHHPIIDLFSSYIHRLQGFDVSTMESCLRGVWTDVCMVTSAVPGLGKTEYIKTMAAEQGYKVKSVHISGPVSRKSLVSRLRTFDAFEACVVHLDIAEVDDPNFLDACLFEFIILGCLCSRTKVVCLPMCPIFFEIANSVESSLRDSLVVLSCFSRVHLQWKNYDNFIVSRHTCSPVQIVCQYLQLLDDGCLDQIDVNLTTKSRLNSLPDEICRELLSRYFICAADLSFSVINIFLNVFGEELKKLSASQYFTVNNLKVMLGEESISDVRSRLVLALLEVAEEFACRSVRSCRSLQVTSQIAVASGRLDTLLKAKATTAELMERRLADMLHWEDTNHLIIAFNSTDSQTISALYKDLSKVPDKIKELFALQLRQPKLPDFVKYTQVDLQEILEKLAMTSLQTRWNVNTDESYALTHDNLLKMVLILLRIRASVPVIIMGETGCGKTSLVRHLAQTCGIQFEQFSMHAGITESDIVAEIAKVNDICLSEPKHELWLFLDEINTCEHMGLLTEIICHRSCLGKRLANNCKFVAACNPYRLRQEHEIATAGLEGKVKRDEYSQLVYRVHSLPETMIDYVWDYGTLHPNDECSYIKQMVNKTVQSIPMLQSLQESIVKLVIKSQEFTRNTHSNEWCVSLRDVHRCQTLIEKFLDILQRKSWYPVLETVVSRKGVIDEKLCISAIVLALAHCYQSRFTKPEHRREYWKECALVLFNCRNQYDELEEIVSKEQMDILDRMEIPPGIAKNPVLCENVFVLFVCILNRIPVFLVGKPGCSKSLSMQLIKSNLRGRDSHDRYFQTLPNLYVVSYQGSESSTSDGIIKVFQKAKKYLDANEEDNILPVVLLDEVGLAEASKFNPLKVLHSLLEPSTGQLPNIAVVGISNWSLDAAKMNRAIHLSRPDMDVHELFETGKFISSSILSPLPTVAANLLVHHKSAVSNDTLRALAEAYFEYETTQRVKNFHGLRDYYALIKYVSKLSLKPDQKVSFQENLIQKGLMRNFGGLSFELKEIIQLFLTQMNLLNTKPFVWTAEEIIRENVEDPEARHLMLITNGDTALGIMIKNLELLKRKYTVIFGSKFAEDQTENYSYRILNRIILCMESERVLVLKDLDSIYGSLYDMLNQNYSRVGMKNNCRIALGPYSNPMCQVNNRFRCVVLVDEQKVDYTDPPFLNRFEKQILRFTDIIDARLASLIEELTVWVKEFCIISQHAFVLEQSFAGYNRDTIFSLVYQITNNKQEDSQSNHSLKLCKKALLWLVPPDVVIRLSKSMLAQKNQQEVDIIQKEYLNQSIHGGLCLALKCLIAKECTDLPPAFLYTKDLRVVVYTHSSIHIDFSDTMRDMNPFTVEKLSAFKSEKQLTKHLRIFFESGSTLLILQCQPNEDGQHIPLAKFQIEELQHEFQESVFPKHICILLHMERNNVSVDTSSQFSFLSGWQLMMVDNVEDPGDFPLKSILQSSVGELLQTNFRPIKECIRDNLLWAFSCTSSSNNERTYEEFSNLLKYISDSELLVSLLSKRILDIIERTDNENDNSDIWNTDRWQIKVALDVRILHSSSSFIDAVKQYLSRCMTTPLANIIYRLESLSALNSYDSNPEVWKDLFLNPDVLCLDNLEVPRCLGCFKIDQSAIKLECPFSKSFIDRLLRHEEMFKQDLDPITSLDGDLSCSEYIPLFTQYRAIFQKHLNLLIELNILPRFEHQFISDIFNIVTLGESLGEDDRLSIVRWFVGFKSNEHKDKDSVTRITESLLCIWRYESLLGALFQLITECRFILPKNLQTVLSGGELEPAFVSHFEYTDEVELIKGKQRSLEKGEIYILGQDSDKMDKVTNRENKVFGSSKDGGTPFPKECLMSVKPVLYSKVSSMCEHLEKRPENRHLIDEYCPKTFSEYHQEETLVSNLCKHLIPGPAVLKDCDGFENWHIKVNVVLSFGCSVSCYPAMLHTLRIFNDLATILHTKLAHSKIVVYLLELADCLEWNDIEHSIDSVDMLNAVLEVVKKCQQDGVTDQDAQQFVSMYILRCSAANPETAMLKRFVDRAATGSLPDQQLSHVEFLIRHIILEGAGDNETKTLMEKLIEYVRSDTNEELFQPPSKLCLLNTGLCQVTVDKPVFLIVCIDALQNFVMNAHCNAHKWTELMFMKSTIDEMICTYNAATVVLQSSKSVSLKLAVSVAYLKTFLDHLAELILYDMNRENCDDHKLLYQNVNSFLSGSISNVFVTYLLKKLKFGRTFDSLKKLVAQIKPKIKFFEHISFADDDLGSSLEYKIFGSTTNINTQLELKLIKLKHDTKPVNEYLDKALHSEEAMFDLLQALAHTTYIPCAVRQLKDSEKQIGKLLLKGRHFPEPYASVIERLTCQRSFGINLLQLTPEVTYLQLHQSCFIVHLMSDLIVSKVKIQLFWECLIQPTMLPVKKIRAMFQGITCRIAKSPATGSFVECKCGMMLYLLESRQQCPICRTDWSSIDSVPIGRVANESRRGISGSRCDVIARTVVKLLLDASLLSSVALNFTSETDLAIECQITLESLQNDFLDGWQILTDHLQLSEQYLVIFLHFVINHFDFSTIKENVEFHSPSEISEYIGTLGSNVVDHISKSSFLSDLKIYRDKILVSHYDVINRDVLEISEISTKSIDNISLISNNVNKTALNVSNLFRLVTPRTMNDMKAQFCRNANNDTQYPVIKVFFKVDKTLQLLNHLLPILKWSCTLQKIVNHCLTRRYCKTTDVKILINTPTEKCQKLRECFDQFRAAWEHIRGSVQILRKIDASLPVDFPQIHTQTILQTMVIEDSESIIYKVLNALCVIQNSFLDELLVVAQSGKCSSLGFMRKSTTNVAAVNCIMLQNVKLNQVIAYDHQKLSDIVKFFGQNDPRLGFGHIVTYNFTKIEMEFATALALAKAHLTMNHTFPFATYANELFMKCTTVLQEVQSVVPQQPLGEMIKHAIEERSKNNPVYTNELMRVIEILLSLVKRTNGCVDQTISNYIQQWLVSLPGNFSADLLPSSGEPLCLSNLVAMYEFVENLQADVVIDSLFDGCKVPLPKHVNAELRQFVDAKYIELQSIKIAFRRFVMRYLTSVDVHQTQVDLKEPLIGWLVSPLLWPSGVKENGTLIATEGDEVPKLISSEFPKMLILEHIYHALLCLDEISQVKCIDIYIF